jgi:hypothetical protein
MDIEPRFDAPELIEQHPELYHYTTLAGLEGILGSQCLWATHYLWLNDSSESGLLKEPLTSAIADKLRPLTKRRIQDSYRARRIVEKAGGVNAIVRKEASRFVKSLYRTNSDYEHSQPFLIPYITSFCSHARDKVYERNNGLLSQWRGYSRGGGCCIVFDTHRMLEHLTLEFNAHYWSHMSVNEVKYVDDEFDFDGYFDHLMNCFIRFYDDLLCAKEPDLTGAFGPFVSSATLLKHQGFREEREVRIIACPATNHIIDMVQSENREWMAPKPLKEVLYRDTQAGNIPYVALFDHITKQLPINRVIIGPSKIQGENYTKARLLLQGVCDVVRSKTPYIG